MTLNCVVIDAGARYGLHPSWADLKGLVEFHLFEMDEVEAQRLSAKYRNEPLIKVYPVALYSSDTTLEFTASEHSALNSVMAINTDLLQQNNYMQKEFAVTGVRPVAARSVDSIFGERDVHFMKLDVEGAEYELLKGAQRQLQSSILGVRSEVLFAHVYIGAPLFGELNQIMLDAGFELLNLDYTGAGNKSGRFTLPGRYGRLLSSDAVWTVGTERLFARTRERLAEDVIRLALFEMSNGATDLAIDLLTRAVTREGVNLKPYFNEPLFVALHKRALFLFKALLSLPQLTQDDITDAYKTIFDRDFPLMNQFYQSELLS